MRLSGYVSGLLGLFTDILRFIKGLFLRPHYIAVLIVLIIGAFYAFGISPQEIGPWVKETAVPAVTKRIGYLKADAKLVVDKAEEKAKGKKPMLGRNGKKAAKDAPRPPVIKPKAEPVGPIPEPVVMPVAKPIEQIEQAEHQGMFEQSFGWDRAFENMKETPSQPVRVEQGMALSGVMTAQATGRRPTATPVEVRREEPKDNRPSIEGQATIVAANRIKIDGKTVTLKGIRLRSGRAKEAYSTMVRQYNGTALKCYLEPSGDMADCFYRRQNIADELVNFNLADRI